MSHAEPSNRSRPYLTRAMPSAATVITAVVIAFALWLWTHPFAIDWRGFTADNHDGWVTLQGRRFSDFRRLPAIGEIEVPVLRVAAGRRHRPGAGLGPTTRDYVRFPPLSAATLAITVTWLIAAAVGGLASRAQRPPPGLRCRRCGYDLRASPGRCPECGHQPGASAG